MKTIDERLQRLEDLEAIRSLIAEYGPLADSGDAAAAAALWAESGAYAVGTFATAAGRSEIAALLESDVHRGLMAAGCGHLLGPVAIELEGHVATARGLSVVFRHMGEGAFEIFRLSANRWLLERVEGQWRVRHRDNALLDGEGAARALLSPPVARHRS